MEIETSSLQELKRICADIFQKDLSDDEIQRVGQRIIQYLRNSESPNVESGLIDEYSR